MLGVLQLPHKIARSVSKPMPNGGSTIYCIVWIFKRPGLAAKVYNHMCEYHKHCLVIDLLVLDLLNLCNGSELPDLYFIVEPTFSFLEFNVTKCFYSVSI